MPPLRFSAAFLRPLGLALCGVVAIGWLRGCDPAPTEPSAYDAQLRAIWHRKMAADEAALRQADSALAQKQDTVTRTIVRYHAVRDTLDIHDTVQVIQFVERADSVVRACTELQSSCERFRVHADSLIADLTTENDALRRAIPTPPGRLSRVWSAVRLPLAFTAGLYVGSKAVR